MKQLQKSDLKEGEIYVARNDTGGSKYIVKINNNMNGCFNIYGCTNILYRNGNFSSVKFNYFEATPEEKHWLETCIKADKFVSYEEAMKTFIPEYVECILLTYPNVKYINFGEIGRIYKVSNYNYSISDMKINEHIFSVGKERFKPSTKEAYDAQFVVKEPEFVLPKLWCIKLTIENQETVIDYINQNTKDGERKVLIGVYYGYNGEHCTCVLNKLSNTEITFDQFQKYVLKEEKETVTIKTTVETKSKFINNNTVETSEGSIFKVGDLVTPFENSSPNKGKKFKITGFRWNNSQTEICAITDLHKPYGIGVEKLEIYLELKVKAEIVDDFVLPEKWCVEVNPKNQNFINSVRDRNCSVTFITSNLILPDVKNSWYCYYDAKKRGFTEITLEQFKKYVLKDE